MNFRNWTPAEIEAAIRSIEQALVDGVASVSYPGGGTVSYVAQSQMRQTLTALEAALARLTDPAKRRLSVIRISTPSKGL